MSTARDVPNGDQRDTDRHLLGRKTEAALLALLRPHFPDIRSTHKYDVVDMWINLWHRLELKARPSLWEGTTPLYDPYLPFNKAKWALQYRETRRLDAIWTTGDDLRAFLLLVHVGSEVGGLEPEPAHDNWRTKNSDPVLIIPKPMLYLIEDPQELIDLLKGPPHLS